MRCHPFFIGILFDLTGHFIKPKPTQQGADAAATPPSARRRPAPPARVCAADTLPYRRVSVPESSAFCGQSRLKPML